MYSSAMNGCRNDALVRQTQVSTQRLTLVTTAIDLPKIAIVIPTLSSPPTLVRLLDSIRLQQLQPLEVIVVAQGNEDVAERIVGSSGVKCARVIRSDPGLSKARNAGIRALQSEWDIVAFPDDDVWYEDTSLLSAAESLLTSYAAISGKVVPEDHLQATRLNFGEAPLQLDARSVWTSAIEAGFFLTRRLIDDVGGFDETLGLGAVTPWQSGEGTDLLLRALSRGHRIGYNPLVQITEATPLRSTAVSIPRARKYARGTGRVYRTRYGLQAQALLLARSLARILIELGHGRRPEAQRAVAVLVGRLEGLTGWIRFGA
jgi:glycosyltransferase involved in cell wall biosynthesis